jgi:hypothetical protein
VGDVDAGTDEEPVGRGDGRRQRLLDAHTHDDEARREQVELEKRIVERRTAHEDRGLGVDRRNVTTPHRNVRLDRPEGAVGVLARPLRRKKRQARDALLAHDAVQEHVHARAPAEVDVGEPPPLGRRLVGVLANRGRGHAGLEELSAVVQERVAVGRPVAADAHEGADRPLVHALICPALARSPRAAPVADAAAAAPRHARLEEDRSARAEAVGLDGSVAAVHLDTIDEPQRHEREVGRAADVVVETDAGEVHRGVGRRGAANGRGGGRAEASRLGDHDARLRAQDVLRLEPRRDETIAWDDGTRDVRVLGRYRVAKGVAYDQDLGGLPVTVRRGRRGACRTDDERGGRDERRRHRGVEKGKIAHRAPRPSREGRERDMELRGQPTVLAKFRQSVDAGPPSPRRLRTAAHEAKLRSRTHRRQVFGLTGLSESRALP